MTITLALMFLVTSSLWAQQQEDQAAKQQQVEEVMKDSTMRAMMAEFIMNNPELHREMMRHMRETRQAKMNRQRDKQWQAVQEVLKDKPELKEHLQAHREIRQVMRKARGDSAMMGRSMPMMQMPMMNMQRRCMEMMEGMRHKRDDMQDRKGMMQDKEDNQR